MESPWHLLVVDESPHGHLGKTGLRTNPKAQEPIFYSADGEIQVHSRYQNTVAEIQNVSQFSSDCFIVPLLELSSVWLFWKMFFFH